MRSAEKAVFWGGLLCGVLDFASAVIAWHSRGATIRGVGQSIAAGLLGRADAMSGDRRAALLGIFLHFVIAFGAAATYYFASRFIRFLTERPVIAGLIYGELVFLFMNMVVLPLSALHRDPLQWTSFSPWPMLITGPLGHPFLVGLPIALATARFAPLTLRRRKRKERPVRPLSCSVELSSHAAYKVQDERDHRHNQQQVNQSASHMEDAESQDPGDQQNDKQNGKDTHGLSLVPLP